LRRRIRQKQQSLDTIEETEPRPFSSILRPRIDYQTVNNDNNALLTQRATTATPPISSKRREALGVRQNHVTIPSVSSLANPYSASASASGFGTEERLRTEMERLRREVESIRNMAEPPPGYA
jgi:hypothetical protein